MQISEIKIADIPDVDLSQLGVTKYGNFSVEVVDPVADYLELMENVFDFSLIRSLVSRPDFSRCNNKDEVVADFYFNTGWQMNFRRNLNDWEIDDFCQLLLQLDYTHIDQSKEDSLVWIASNDGTFSVKKCYSLLMKQTRFWNTSWPWKEIWRTKAPIKLDNVGNFFQYLRDILDHASTCEGIIGELAVPENTQSFEAKSGELYLCAYSGLSG
ncbi:hypothetical protein H5410_016635 [Solanum commersonii]|uniref:Uncharacterized protein n=1 Tax=Solanum commersonii TaxID=4109 RepID=A0A9J5ZXJ7_SOLCO|nr:hypothetical protein H5410_016635 [Solanum commersonii]